MDKKLSLQGPLFIFCIVVILGVSASLLYVLKSENRFLVKKMNASALELQKLQSQPKKEEVKEEKQPTSVMPVTSDQLTVIAKVFSNAQAWEKFTSDNGNVSMSYPKNLFLVREPKVYINTGTGFRLSVLTQETWKKDAGDQLDGVSEGLGDPDDYDFNWNQQFAAYNEILKNNNQLYHFGFESGALAQRIKTIKGIPFIVGIVVGTNGSCDIEYVTFQKNTKMDFSADICDDPMFLKYNFNDFKDKKAIALAQNILDGDSVNFVTETKINALEKVINTLTVKK